MISLALKVKLHKARESKRPSDPLNVTAGNSGKFYDADVIIIFCEASFESFCHIYNIYSVGSRLIEIPPLFTHRAPYF